MRTVKNPDVPIKIDATPYAPAEVWYVANEKAYRRFARKLKLKNPVTMHWDAQGCTAEFLEGKYQAVTTRSNLDGGVCHIAAVIAHECVHLWQNLKGYIGEDSPGEEVEAYIIDHFVEQVMKAYLDTTVDMDDYEQTVGTVDSGSVGPGEEGPVGDGNPLQYAGARTPEGYPSK